MRTSSLIRLAMAVGLALFTAVDAEAQVGVNVQTPNAGVVVQTGGLHAGPGGVYGYPPGHGAGYRRGVRIRAHARGRCGRFGCRMRVRGRCGRGGCGGGFARGGCFGGGCGMPSMRRFAMVNMRVGGWGGGFRGGCRRSRCF